MRSNSFFRCRLVGIGRRSRRHVARAFNGVGHTVLGIRRGVAAGKAPVQPRQRRFNAKGLSKLHGLTGLLRAGSPVGWQRGLQTTVS